jgi:hypothetical protein
MDKDRTDEKLHKYIHITKNNQIGLVDTKIGGNLVVSKNISTNSINAYNIGNDLSGNANFLDVSSNSLHVFGDAFITGTLEINNLLRKTLTDIDITGDLNLDNKLDVSGLFTTHGGINIDGIGDNNTIDNVNIGYDVSGKGSFTDLSCNFFNANSFILSKLDQCNIGSIEPSYGSFTDLSSHIFKVGTNSTTGNIISIGNQDLEFKTGNIYTGLIRLVNGINENINIEPHGNGLVYIPKVNINNGIINNIDMSSSNITLDSNNTCDLSNGTFIISTQQKSDIFKNGALYNSSDIDIKNYNFRAMSLTADSLPQNKIIYTGIDGLLSTENNFTYDPINNELVTDKIGSFTSTGPINFNNQILTNININNGTIDNTIIKTSDITVGISKSIDVQYANLITSNSQNINILHNAALNNDNDLDFQGYGIRAANLTADALPYGRIIFTGSEGVLSVKPELLYDPSDNKLTVNKISPFQCQGNIDFFDNSAVNVNVYNGTILQCDVSNSNINISENYKLDTTNGILYTSNSQNSTIFKNGALNNDSNIDIGNHDFRASTLTADSLTTGQIIYTDTDGLLTTESGFEYNTTANTMTVQNITCSGLFTLSQTVNSITPTISNTSINLSYTKTALITTASFSSFLLQDSTEGHTILIYLKLKGNANGATINVTSLHNGSNIVLSNIGSNISLMFIDSKWLVTSLVDSIIS